MRKKGSNRVSSFLFLISVALLNCSIIFTIISCGISNDSPGNIQNDYDLNSSSFFIDDEPGHLIGRFSYIFWKIVFNPLLVERITCHV